MDTTVAKKPFNRRAFVSLTLFVSGALLPFSGYMNHLLQFDHLTPEKHFWMSVHNVAAILFTLSAITHIVTNWRALLHYAKRVQGVVVSKEAALAALLVLGVVGLIAAHAFHVH